MATDKLGSFKNILKYCHCQAPVIDSSHQLWQRGVSLNGASMVLSDATTGITIKQPVLLIIHYSLVTTSADAATDCPGWYVP
jgi:hypothetical protein